MTIKNRLQKAWNAFLNKDPTELHFDYGISYGARPDRPRLRRGNERTIVTAILNKMAVDAATITIKHVKLDENERYLNEIYSGLDNCLNLSANKDQTGRAFRKDLYMSLFDEGCIAIVPIDTDIDPMKKGYFDILSMRVGKITEWYPDNVKINVYNDRTGHKEDITLPKEKVAIIENPFYSIMNEPSSTLQRLIRKLSLLDTIDEQKGANKLDMIVQLPYVIKTDAKREQAERRRKDIEMQLNESKYGIAYTDGTEKIVQLNRSIDNQLQGQVEYLTNLLYSQLGIDTSIMNGTASDATMNNYFNCVIEPIVAAVVDELKVKFLTKTARTQGQSIIYFRDPFKLVPVSQLADMADKLTRNEILTSNEVRQIIGIKPAGDPGADELRNKNISKSKDEVSVDKDGNPIISEGGEYTPNYDTNEHEEVTYLTPEERISEIMKLPMKDLQ